MNATARALVAGTFTSHNIRHMFFSLSNLLLMFVLLALLSTSFAVIYVKDMNRREFIELQNLQRSHDEMLIEQGRLLLEQNTWSSPIRVQNAAVSQLGMTNPAKNTIVFVR